MNLRPALALALALPVGLLPAAPAAAEIVNVLTPTVGPQPDSWSLKLGQSFSGSGGNVNKLALLGNLGLRWQLAPHQLMLVGSAAFAKSTGVVDTQAVFGHLRYRWTFADPFTLLTFVQGNHDRFRLLTARVVAGLGAEVRILRLNWLEWNVGATVMPEYELLNEGAVDRQGFFLRGSTFLAQAYQVQDWLRLANTSFWQPGLADLGDYRLLNDLSLQLKVTTFLSIKFSAHLVYDSLPPEGVEPLDWSLSQGIVINYTQLIAPPAE